jgi:hypothetical protein
MDNLGWTHSLLYKSGIYLESKEHCSCCNHDEYCINNDDNDDFVICEWYLCNGSE